MIWQSRRKLISIRWRRDICYDFEDVTFVRKAHSITSMDFWMKRSLNLTRMIIELWELRISLYSLPSLRLPPWWLPRDGQHVPVLVNHDSRLKFHPSQCSTSQHAYYLSPPQIQAFQSYILSVNWVNNRKEKWKFDINVECSATVQNHSHGAGLLAQPFSSKDLMIRYGANGTPLPKPKLNIKSSTLDWRFWSFSY